MAWTFVLMSDGFILVLQVVAEAAQMYGLLVPNVLVKYLF
jgi:hypothetical protein